MPRKKKIIDETLAKDLEDLKELTGEEIMPIIEPEAEEYDGEEQDPNTLPVDDFFYAQQGDDDGAMAWVPDQVDIEGIGAAEMTDGQDYIPRLSTPSKTDKNWLKTTHGGYNYCILGSPLYGTGSCLSNCVGYAWGRWREILGAYHKLSRGNAENWWANTGDGYERGQTPRVGAVICWRKGQAGNSSDGAGHVAIVEKVYSDGSIVTSNSAYGGSTFYLKTIKPPYELGGTFHFQGFIYNPKVKGDIITKLEDADEFFIGDEVVVNGPLYRSSTTTSPSGSISNKTTKITRKVLGAPHPYNTTGDLGWMDASSIKKVVKEEVKPVEPEKPEEPVKSYELSSPLFGIDVSTWQGGLDWGKVKAEGVKFAMLRAGYTGSSNGISKAVDNQFETFYKAAKAQGIGVGAYWFSRATTYDNGKAEAEYMYENCLKGKQFEYPIAIDVEDGVYQAKASKAAITAAIKGFCETLEAKGYYVSIYANLNWFRNYMNVNELSAYDKWVAYWGSTRPDSPVGKMWQFGGSSNAIRSTQIAGMTIDQDYAYRDFPAIMKDKSLNGFKAGEEIKPEPKPEPQPVFKFNIGDKVVINGPLYRSSNATSPSGSIKDKTTVITRRVNAPHPYNTTGDLGWMDESSIKAYSAPAPAPVSSELKKGDKVKVLKAVTYTGGTFKTWYKVYDVLEVSGDRIVIGIGRTVTAAVNRKNLQKV